MSQKMRREKPLISIIVPVYKTELYLRDCIDSLLKQTVKNIEIILVDDGSPDNCGALCDEYAALDDRIIVLHKKNQGLLKARISGVSFANAEYVGFVDSDDRITPDYFEKLYNTAILYNADIVYCSLTFLYEEYGSNRYKVARVGFSGEYEGEDLRKTIYPNLLYDYASDEEEKIPGFMVTKLYRKSILNDAFREVPKHLHIYEDVAVSFYAALEAKKVAFISDSVRYYYRQRSDSILHAFRTDYFEDVRTLLKFLKSSISKFKVEYELGTTFGRYSTGRALRVQESIAYSPVTFRYLCSAAKELVTSPLWVHDEALDFFSSPNNRMLRKFEIYILRKRSFCLCWVRMMVRHVRFLLCKNK